MDWPYFSFFLQVPAGAFSQNRSEHYHGMDRHAMLNTRIHRFICSSLLGLRTSSTLTKTSKESSLILGGTAITRDSLWHSTKHDLRRECKRLGLLSSGTKYKLQHRLANYYQRYSMPIPEAQSHLHDSVVSSRTSRQHRLDALLEHIDPGDTYLLQFDGGARGDPVQVTGAGMVILDSTFQRELWCGYQCLSKRFKLRTTKNHGTRMTCRQAEYWGLILILEKACEFGIERVIIQGDARTVIDAATQSNPPSVCEKEWRKATSLLQNFDHVQIEHIPRTENIRADLMAQIAINHESDGQYWPPIENHKEEDSTMEPCLCSRDSNF